MNRIVTPDGMIPQGDDAPRPPTLEERLQTAVVMWKQGQKAQAFATSLNCIAYLSKGLAGLATLTGHMREESEGLRKQNEELKKRIEALEAKT